MMSCFQHCAPSRANTPVSHGAVGRYVIRCSLTVIWLLWVTIVTMGYYSYYGLPSVTICQYSEWSVVL
ncbi:hypothetical protein J4Q44_G00340640 [Coregonus suidteri]|uniref:Uncharacterized protein n=1 Tax=Coregonus suidteri TaxID=861788 RepID=A0AAN8KP81_9TELE